MRLGIDHVEHAIAAAHQLQPHLANKLIAVGLGKHEAPGDARAHDRCISRGVNWYSGHEHVEFLRANLVDLTPHVEVGSHRRIV